jgi:hypothetical protein
LKRLIISELLISSEKERKGRREMFDPVRTIIFGANETGKSSLIKSIYQAFGAEPAKINPRWKAAETKTPIKFSVDGERYQLLRDSSYFAIFNGEGKFLKAFTRVATELGPYLAELFDFGLILASRDDEPQVPPPAYLFLPFYMDQDASWSSSWSAFDRLWQFSNWKDSVVDYHTGIRNNAYYRTNAELIDKRNEFTDAVASEKGVATVLKRLDADATFTSFSIDLEVFGERIQRLLGESKLLAEAENDLRTRLTKLNGEAALQRNRLEIAEKALGEITADFKFLSSVTTESVECPTCGNHYENDFAVRFAVATDEDRVVEFIAHIRAELSRLEQQITEVYQKYSVAKEQAENIQKILLETQGEVTLQTVIESEGRRAADKLLLGQLENARVSRNDVESALNKLREELKGLDTHAMSRRSEVLTKYEVLLRKNFLALDVDAYSQAVFRTLAPSQIETGSTLPRALLAYQFAIFELITEYSPATLCPFVIDSPNQQGQDKEHLPQILRFIADNQPLGSQLILGIENDTGVVFGGKTIRTPITKYSLLEPKQFSSVHDEIFSLLKLSLQ